MIDKPLSSWDFESFYFRWFSSIWSADQKMRWSTWTPTRAGWTDVGTPTVTARYCQLGNVVFFQIKVVPATTVATTAGTSYISLPLAAGASSITGEASMTNLTTLVAVGVGVIDVANSRVYVPTQGATGNTLEISGFYEA